MTKINPHHIHFNDLMQDIRRGRVRIPDFQREFVWERSQIVSLLNSIYKHYPIGSFLFWRTDQEIQSYRQIGEIELEQDTDRSVDYVLDGQQRLTSLFASLVQATIPVKINGKKITKKLEIYFDLDKEDFVVDPFKRSSEKKIYKILGFPAITGHDDCLSFMVAHMQRLLDSDITEQEIRKWLQEELPVSMGRARHYQSCFRNMGLLSEQDGFCKPTEAGRAVAIEKDVVPILQGFIDGIAFMEELLRKMLERDSVDMDKMLEYLETQYDHDIRQSRVRSRFQWIARLGLGVMHKNTLSLNDKGRAEIRKVLHSNDTKRQESDKEVEKKKKRYLSVQQITNVKELIQMARGLSESRAQALDKVVARFREYPFSVIDVLD
ncbi:DUF262 domain-containing protein, partial [bacterium]|nr:DUF262 domain-containing protein [bacterium]